MTNTFYPHIRNPHIRTSASSGTVFPSYSSMNLASIIGISAGILTATSLVPQLIKIIKEKKAADVSPLMLVILLAGVGLWTYYGVLKNDWPIIVTNACSFLLNTVIIVLKYTYARDR